MSRVHRNHERSPKKQVLQLLRYIVLLSFASGWVLCPRSTLVEKTTSSSSLSHFSYATAAQHANNVRSRAPPLAVPPIHLDQNYTHGWLERVLGPDRVRWEALAGIVQAPALTDCDEASLGPRGVLGDDATGDSLGLTSAVCKPSYGYGGHCYQTCRFHNLYVVPGAHTLEAHVLDNSTAFPFARVDKIQPVVHGFVRKPDAVPRVVIRRHATVEAFLSSGPFRVDDVDTYSELSVAMSPLWHNNIGHALYDYLYPAFLELLHWGLGDRKFRAVVHLPGGVRNYADKPSNVERQKLHEELYGVFAGFGVTRTIDIKARTLCLKDVLVGAGTNSDEYDMNVNFTLAGGVGPLDAVRKFRDRMMDKFNVMVRPRTPGNTKVKAILINSDIHMPTPWWREAIAESAQYGVELTHVDWATYGKNNEASKESAAFGSSANLSTAAFASHLQLLAETDVHIAGPGTAMMYQQLLRDGSVHVNLGHDPTLGGFFHTSRYMDEFMAEGAPHIRCIYALMSGDRSTRANTVGRLADAARRLVLDGFPIPVARGINLSPTTTVIKAYAHLQYGTRLHPLMPFSFLPGEEQGLSRLTFNTQHRIARVSKAEVYNEEEARFVVANPCLLAALGRDFNWGDPNHLDWFEQFQYYEMDTNCITLPRPLGST